MSYSLRVSETGDYLVVRVEGALTILEARAFSAEAHAKSQEAGIDKILFDVREAPNEASPDANYLFVEHDMDRLGLSRTTRSAILKSADDASHDEVETAMNAAGFKVRSFTDLEAAVAWLRA